MRVQIRVDKPVYGNQNNKRQLVRKLQIYWRNALVTLFLWKFPLEFFCGVSHKIKWKEFDRLQNFFNCLWQNLDMTFYLQLRYLLNQDIEQKIDIASFWIIWQREGTGYYFEGWYLHCSCYKFLVHYFHLYRTKSKRCNTFLPLVKPQAWIFRVSSNHEYLISFTFTK